MHVDPYRRYREGNILDLDHYRGPTLSRTLIRILRILLATWLAVLSTQVAVVSSREKKREPTLWVLRIEGDKQEYLVPVEVLPGVWVARGPDHLPGNRSPYRY